MITIDQKKCIGCGACVKDCTRGILELADGKARLIDDTCIFCGHCYCVCPVNAISFPDEPLDGAEEITSEDARLDPEKLLLAIKARRSIRHFQKKPVEPEKIQRIIDAARFTPTGGNRQGTKFIVIQNDLPEITNECLQAMKDAAEHPEAANTPMLPFYTERWIESERLYREEGIDRLFYDAPLVLVLTGSDVIDTALAASNAELMISAEGLGCVYVGFCRYAMNTERLRKKLKIADNQEEICCLAIGYPDVHYLRTAPRQVKRVRYL